MFLFPCSYNEAFAFVAFVLMFIRYALECLISYSCSCIDVFVFAIMKLQIRLLPYSYGEMFDFMLIQSCVCFRAQSCLCTDVFAFVLMLMHECVCFRDHFHGYIYVFASAVMQ